MFANPTDNYACQWRSSPPARSFTYSHICQLDLLGTVDFTVFVSWWCDVCSNLQCYTDNPWTFPLCLTCTDYSIICRWLSLQHCRLSNVANLTDKDLYWLFPVNPTEKYARQWSSSPQAWSSTGLHICPLDLLRIADYIVFISKISTFVSISCRWVLPKFCWPFKLKLPFFAFHCSLLVFQK